MAAQGVVNFEMEASAVLTLAALAGRRAGVVCTVYAQRTSGAFIGGDLRREAEAGLVATGLEALHVLSEMDAQCAGSGELHWRPSHWGAKMAL
jgi:uridine phosphorylase